MDFKTDILPFKDKIFRTALRITLCREEAEDITQDVLMRLWRQKSQLAFVNSLEAYAITMARNLSLDCLKKKASSTVNLDEGSVTNLFTENPYDKIYAQEGLRHIYSIMMLLPEKQRTCMALRDFEGKNYREIAEILGITEDQVKINIFRARKFVKQKVSEMPF